ncbi:MAG: hypothetical protein RL739_3096 [Pseudomonadota bacterium]
MTMKVIRSLRATLSPSSGPRGSFLCSTDMLQPLISLWRHHARVTFYDALSSRDATEADLSGLTFGSPVGVRRHFFHVDEAMSYLRYWMGDPGAVSELRWLLTKSGPALSGARGGPDQWLQVLAHRMQSGALVAVEETAKRQFLGKMVATSAASGLSSLTSLADLANLTSIPAPSMLMPDLTALQIDGAQVLPEVDQAIAQMKTAISEVSDFSVSLSPAPAKVLDIQSAMSIAGGDAQAKLSSM